MSSSGRQRVLRARRGGGERWVAKGRYGRKKRGRRRQMDRLKARQPAKDCVGSSVSEIARIPPFAAGRSVLPPRSVQRRARSPEYARWRQFKVAAASCGGEASREALSKAGSHFHPSNCGWPHRTADGRTRGRRTRTEEDVVAPGSARPLRRPSVPPSVGRSEGRRTPFLSLPA